MNRNLAGYATFAVDLLGAGNSTRANALHEVQTQAQVEICSQLVESLKAGTIDGQQWQREIWVGYSLGSFIDNSIATQYPSLLDQLILISMSWDRSYMYRRVHVLIMFRGQANDINETRWGSLPGFYSTFSIIERRIFSHLYGNFDPGVIVPDYKDLDADIIGETIMISFHSGPAPYYTGPVLLAFGNNDPILCGVFSTNQHLEVYNMFPNASDHAALLYPNNGHNILLHRPAPQVMSDVLQLIRRNEG